MMRFVEYDVEIGRYIVVFWCNDGGEVGGGGLGWVGDVGDDMVIVS